MISRIPSVGVVVDDLGHGGAQKQLVLLARALRPHVDVHVYVLSSIEEPHGRTLRARGISVTVFPRRSGFDVVRLRALVRALADDRVDVVHGFLDASCVYAYLAARRIRKPVVMSLQSDRFTMPGTRARVLGWMHRKAEAVVVNSIAGRDFLIDRVGVQRERVYVVRNIAEVPEVATTPDHTSSPIVGCVGRLVALKRFDLAVQALPRVRAAVPGARLELVGEGPVGGELRALCERLGVADAVDFIGAVDDATVRIARMSCLALPSAFEGLPNAALEAMACGVPVVASAVGDVASIVIDGSTGVVVRDTTSESLAAGIIRALTDPALRARALAEGPRTIRMHFNADEPVAVLRSLYERLRA